jgi:Flp pilus assembly protein TadD
VLGDAIGHRALLGADPLSHRADRLLAGALGDPAARLEQIEAYHNAMVLNPDSARAHSGLAWALAMAGRSEDALPHARRAMDLAPSDPNVLDAVAFVDAGLGRCPEALQLQRRALAAAGADDLQRVRARLQAYEASCGDAPAVELPRAPARGPAMRH